MYSSIVNYAKILHVWDESDETDPGRIEQVWFPGVHSDVGGGYPKHSLSLVALEFLVSPFVLDCIKKDLCTATNGLFDPLLKMATNMLPDLAAPWIKVLRNFPNLFYGLVLIFGVLFVLKAKLWAKTQWFATTAWAALKK